MIFLTTFDPDTKLPTAASAPLYVETLAEAEGLMPGAPEVRTRNTLIYGGGICLSWIRFSIDFLES